MHRPIRKFGFSGTLADDSKFVSLRAQYETLIIHNMRDVGFVPVLDLDTLWSTSFDAATKQYSFTISVFGIYVGKAKAKTIEGMSGQGKLYPKVLPR
jgi:hypothetical protein